MGGGIADAGGQALSDDGSQGLIPLGKSFCTRSTPEISRFGELGGEASQSGQQGQAESAGPLQWHGGWHVFGAGQDGVALTFGHQPTQSQSSQCPEQVPPGLGDVLILPPMVWSEAPAELRVLQPLHQRWPVAVGFVQVEAIGNQRVLEEFLHLIQREAALQALEQLKQGRCEGRGDQAATAHQPEREARFGSGAQSRFD